jgi:hypothetical protein
MLIIEVMIEGAEAFSISSKLVTHLNMIKRSMKPNRASNSTICGKNSKKKSIFLPNYTELKAFMNTPRDICKTPKITESFILREFI